MGDEPAPAKPRGLTRRRFLIRLAAGAAAAGSSTAAYAWFVEPSWVELVERPLPIDGLPAALHGATLVQMSDLHVGGYVPESHFLETFEQVADRRPDFVVFTGDIVSWRPDATRARLEQVFRRVPHGRIGTLAILGNHDWGRAWSERDVADEVAAVLRESGVDVLRNDARELHGLVIAGLDDLWSPGWRPDGVVRALASRPSILLCHNPDGADRPGLREHRGWILAGHTHGGQLRPPFLRPPLLPVRNHRYTSGEFVLENGGRLYVNRGLGASLRLRFNARPEVTCFTLAGT